MLGALDRSEEAVGVYDEVSRALATRPSRRCASRSPGRCSTRASRSGRLSAPRRLSGLRRGVARFGDATEPALREQVARALVNRASGSGRLSAPRRRSASTTRWSRALATRPSRRCASRSPRRWSTRASRSGRLSARGGIGVYDEVVARFGDAPEPALREQVAKALVNKGVTLGALESLRGGCRRLRRGGRALRRRARAGAARAGRQGAGQQGRHARGARRSEEAVGVYDEVVARFGDATEPALREQVARALVNKGVTLGALERSEEGSASTTRWSRASATRPSRRCASRSPRRWSTRASRSGRSSRSEEAVGVYDEVVARFGDAPEPALREQVAKALVNKGVALGALERSEEAVGVYDEVITRFGDATEPILRQAAAMARTGTLATWVRLTSEEAPGADTSGNALSRTCGHLADPHGRERLRSSPELGFSGRFLRCNRGRHRDRGW